MAGMWRILEDAPSFLPQVPMPARDIVISLRSETKTPRAGEPVTCGVPFPRGLLPDASVLRIIGPDGSNTPLQVRVLDSWPDGSARWALCDWRATTEGTADYRLRIEEHRIPTTTNVRSSPTTPVSEEAAKNAVREIGHALFSSETLRLISGARQFRALPDFDWFIVEAGPRRVSILEQGTLTCDGDNLARYRLKTHYFAETSTVRVHVTITNPNRAAHPGGMWDLGDSGSIAFSELSLTLPMANDGRKVGRVSLATGRPWSEFTGTFQLHQASSGGENWQSHNHLAAHGISSIRHCGFYTSLAAVPADLHRATPILTIEGDKSLTVSIPEFWQNFPSGLAVTLAGIEVGLFPRMESGQHELQGGEQKEQVFFVANGHDAITEFPLEWTRDPLIPLVDPEWIASTGAIPYFSSASTDPHRDYQRLANSAIEGDDTFETKRETIDEYGWRHFGDIYGDHEAILHTDYGPKPRVSHYNNQYDAVAGFAVHWLRSGDARWFHQLNELASHVRDIDIYNTDADKAAYNHGLFWHTYHYVDADTGTHRSYPRNGRIPPHNKPVPGGGPGSEQNYAHGLMLHYYLTGDEASKEAAIGLAQWVIDMDDGRRTVFRWLSGANTGLASASRSPDYHGPGRGPGNSVAALLDGHQLTGDAKFLQKAEQLIRRVIHPADDVTRMIGMVRDGKLYVDAENRWFYVMFLVSLGKYLDRKAELGELDEHYAYARASLLHYARWMAEHEYPYLDRPEILEYPTETWAAQDMWKSEVFDFAFLHAEGDERTRFRERAEFFFRASVDKLGTMPTRTLCRPVVLMLSHGWRRAWFAAHPDESRPKPALSLKDFGPRVPFVPQKAIAKKRAKMLVAGGALFGVVAIVAFLIWLLT